MPQTTHAGWDVAPPLVINLSSPAPRHNDTHRQTWNTRRSTQVRVLKDARCTPSSYRYIMSFVSKNRLRVSDRGRTYSPPSFSFVHSGKHHLRGEMAGMECVLCNIVDVCAPCTSTRDSKLFYCSRNNTQGQKWWMSAFEENLIFSSILMFLIVLGADTVFSWVQERLIPAIEQSFSYLPQSRSLAAPKVSCFCHFGQVKRLQLELRGTGWKGNNEQGDASRILAITPGTTNRSLSFSFLLLKKIPKQELIHLLFSYCE